MWRRLASLLLGAAPAAFAGDGLRSYPFLFAEGTELPLTMRQVNENFLSVHRLALRSLGDAYDAPALRLVHLGVDALLLLPLTHEEAHRSVLSSKHIGSVSQPWFGPDGTARVVGVRDETLRDLRDRDLPTFIRLHTAGLESDARICLAAETLAAWGEERTELLWTDHAVRRLSLMGYLASGLLRWNPDIAEEKDELDRDIVGHDVYGAARHLHRPSMPFRRYTEWSDLTEEERRFVRRVGWRSLANLGSPLLWGKAAWEWTEGRPVAASVAHGLTPFGDALELSVWGARVGAWGLHAYGRAMQNRRAWFPAAGLRWADLSQTRIALADVAVHLWRQPDNLLFNTRRGEWGGALEATVRLRVARPTDRTVLRLDLGVLAKTRGYLPEATGLRSAVLPRLGCSLVF
ncbi:MAG: hypothetical protein N2652_02695 [Kiritimatiellae bacterium]|nr:hypothetical protein [Kiritimatiellia bacterium]